MRRLLALATTCLVVGAVVAFVHAPVLRVQAHALDDSDYVTYNPLVSQPGWASVSRFFGEVIHPSSFSAYYHPLAMVSLMLDYEMGARPDDLRVFHRTSLVLHALNAMLVAGILYALFGDLLAAATVALLFGLHPLSVEPVAWVGERKALLATTFALASVLAYVQHARGRGRGWLVASLAGFALALLSKPTVTALPLMLPLLDWWPLRRLNRAALLEKIPFVLLSITSGAITVISQRHVGGIAPTGISDVLAWPLRTCFVLASHVGRMFWPARLTCIYPQPDPLSWSNPILIATLAIVLVGTALALAPSRRWPAPAVGWLFFVLGLAPTLGLVKYTWALTFDNYAYFPVLGFLVVLAGAVAAARKSAAFRGAAATAVLLTIALGVSIAEAAATRATLRHWTSDEIMNRHMERITPDSPVIHNRVGVWLEKQSRHAEALERLRRSVELAPNYGLAHYNLGLVLAGQGRMGEALQHFQMAAGLLPDDADAAFNFGVALGLTGNRDEAATALRNAVRLRPNYVEAMDQLGGILLAEGKAPEAVAQFRAAVALRPADGPLRYKLASALSAAGAPAREVASELEAALAASPDWAPPLNDLAWLRATSPNPEDRDPARAIELAKRALDSSGGRDPRLLDTLAAAQAAAGRYSEAAATAREAIRRAEAAGLGELAGQLRSRLRLYERSTPYLEAPAVAN